MKPILLLLLAIGIAQSARAAPAPYRVMAVCKSVINGNYHGHATHTVTMAYAQLRKLRTGFKVWTLDGVETGCDSRANSPFEACMKTKNHLLMEKVNKSEHEHVLGVYSINSNQLHITKEQRGVAIADLVLQCTRK